jgi:hypothetical protein
LDSLRLINSSAFVEVGGLLAANTSGIYSDNFTLTAGHDRLAIVFSARNKEGGTDNITLDNVNVTVTGSGAPDTTPPTPNPAAWASVPTNVGSCAVTMTATTGSDANGVEYYFAETTGNPGRSDSGWRSSPVYSDAGLDALTQYGYTVQMRASAGNTGTVRRRRWMTQCRIPKCRCCRCRIWKRWPKRG